MAASVDGPGDSLLLVRLGYRAAPPGLQARVFVEDLDYAPLLEDLRAAGFAQGVVLATCERLEVLTATRDAGAESALAALIAQWADCPREEIDPLLGVLRGQAALRHLFAVAAALDSQIIGEPQILGQVRTSHRAAQDAGLVGPDLDAALHAAYVTARRVRSETALAQHPVSIAAAAIKVARQVLGDPRRASALLLGLGEMGEIMAAQLKEAGIAELAVTHPSERRAETAARRLAIHQRSWDDLESALASADIVVAALGEGRYILDEARLRRVFKRRRQRPMFIMDAAVPRDVEPAVETLEPAFVYDLGELEQVAQEGLARREEAALAAWRIVEAELDAFRDRQDSRAADSALSDLYLQAESLRAEVLSSGKYDAETATRLLLKRLLLAPSQALRTAARDEAERAELEAALRRLFRLEDSRGADGASRADGDKDGSE